MACGKASHYHHTDGEDRCQDCARCISERLQQFPDLRHGRPGRRRREVWPQHLFFPLDGVFTATARANDTRVGFPHVRLSISN